MIGASSNAGLRFCGGSRSWATPTTTWNVGRTATHGSGTIRSSKRRLFSQASADKDELLWKPSPSVPFQRQSSIRAGDKDQNTITNSNERSWNRNEPFETEVKIDHSTTADSTTTSTSRGQQRPPSHTTNSFCSTERHRATAVVDDLLERTRQWMQQNDDDPNERQPENSQRQQHQYSPRSPTSLEEGMSYFTNHTIAFSGGVDSSLVAALVHRVSQELNQQQQQRQLTINTTSPNFSTIRKTKAVSYHHHHTVRCVMGVSAAVPAEQIVLAESIAHGLGIAFSTVATHEGRNEIYRANAGRACLACKTELYSTLHAIYNHPIENNNSNDNDDAVSKNHDGPIEHIQSRHFLYNGTNADDLRDPTRLGLLAAANFSVRSPIDAIVKQDVRLAARHLGLPNWNAAASPCLRSRLALGVTATTENLHRIAHAERFVRAELLRHDAVTTNTNLRVRLLAGQQARLEIDAGPALDAACAIALARKEQWDASFIDEMVFSSWSIAPFRSGSVATTTGTIATTTTTAAAAFSHFKETRIKS